MTNHRKITTMIMTAIVITACGSAALIAKSGKPLPEGAELTLYGSENMQGEAVKVTRDIANLQSVQAAESFDGTANDFAFSLRSTGQWQVCMDANYQTDCFTVDGDMASLGERGGSISSARYIGPSARQQAVAPGPAASTSAKKPRAAGTAAVRPQTPAISRADDWQPMYNVDLYGNDYRAINYERTGFDWRTCKATCDGDRQCQAWTYVEPGRTPYGECFLKSPVPAASSSECCVSGVKGGQSSGGRRGDAAISVGFGRFGATAGRAAEEEVDNAVDRNVRNILGRILGN